MAYKDTASFFTNGNSSQFEFVLNLYPQVLKLKAEKRAKKPEELVRLDEWYQNELPKLIKKRGKDAHLVHEELVQCMKWKQARGKFFPQLSYLIKVNTPRAVMVETKKAFKKLPNLEQAITCLSNLKGVGITMASALVAAAAPELAPFMADECLMAIPEIEGIDYTTKEYMNFVQHIETTANRLNQECSAPAATDENEENNQKKWSLHKVELALWTHYVASDLQPELLNDLPESIMKPVTASHTNGASASPISASTTLEEPSDESNLDTDNKLVVNGDETNDSLDECTRSEDSLDKAVTSSIPSDDVIDSDSQSSTKRSLYGEESSVDLTDLSEPAIKKIKND